MKGPETGQRQQQQQQISSSSSRSAATAAATAAAANERELNLGDLTLSIYLVAVAASSGRKTYWLPLSVKLPFYGQETRPAFWASSERTLSLFRHLGILVFRNQSLFKR